MKLPPLFLLLGILTAAATPVAPAPEATVNDFFAYLLSPKHHIMKDSAAQKTQYPGETRKMTVLLTQEEGAWRVSNIFSHKAKFNDDSTLLGDLRNLTKQH